MACDLLLLLGLAVLLPALVLNTPLQDTLQLSLATASGVLVINNLTGFYEPRYARPFSQTFARAVLSVTVAMAVALTMSIILPQGWLQSVQADGRITGVLMAATGAVMVWRAASSHRARGRIAPRRRILVLGTGGRAHDVTRILRQHNPAIEIIGHVEGPVEADRQTQGLVVLPRVGTLAQIAKANAVDEVVVAITERRGGATPLRELLDCRLHGLEVNDISTHFERNLGQVRLDHVSAHWLIFGEGFNQSRVRAGIKRAFDVVASALLLIPAVPVMAIAAVAIRLESPGHPLFHQERVGLGGRPFRVWKLRSMRLDAEVDGRPQWAVAGDSRITRVGRLIRNTRIDELPQLFNVLRGDMSLVGPRPERPFFVDQLTQEIPFYAVRHSVKPGLTGWAQVRCDYGSSVDEAKVKLEYDLYYVKNHSLFLDILVALETVGVVITGKGAR